jgi:excisionase family DNA binding protein
MIGTPDKLSYRIPEAIEATGLKRSKLYEEIKAGRLQTTKVGGCTLIPTESLRALVSPKQEAA